MAKLTWAEHNRLERLAERIKADDMPRQLDGMSGYRWAATSNAGLPKGKWRLTFLPESAFTVDDELAEKLAGNPTETDREISDRLSALRSK